MINNLSSICYLIQDLLTAESSAGTLIQYQCSRKLVIIDIFFKVGETSSQNILDFWGEIKRVKSFT